MNQQSNLEAADAGELLGLGGQKTSSNPALGSARFAEANAFLTRYAQLPFDAKTGKANDPKAEQQIVDGIRSELEPHVRRFIRLELHLPRVNWDDCDSPPANFREQEAIEAYERFWEVFVQSLRKRRQTGKPPVAISSGRFLRYWVIRIVRWRGPSPIDALNAAINDYLKPGADRESQLPAIVEALRRCCEEFLAKVRNGREHHTPDDETKIQTASEVLRDGFVAGLWQKGVTLKERDQSFSEEFLDVAELLELNERQVRHCPVRYVDTASFRVEARPLLLGGPAPTGSARPAAPTRKAVPLSLRELANLLLGAQSREDTASLREIVSNQCERLRTWSGNQTTNALRHLMVLLFLPSYDPRPETQFCRDCEKNGLRITDPAKNQSKGYWARVLVEGLVARQKLQVDGPLQGQIIDVVQKKGFFSTMIKQLVDFPGLECSDRACNSLARRLPDSTAVLSDFWQLSIGSPARHVAAWADFRHYEKAHAPPGVGDGGEAELPKTLALPKILALDAKGDEP